MLSIIIPVLDEAAQIESALGSLAPLRRRGHEVVVVDGGSRDGTAALARLLADRVIEAPRGRASQMNAGAACARGDMLLFLHADTRLPDGTDHLIFEGLARAQRVWGRFDASIEGRSPLFAVVSTMMNWRSRLTGIATGDQAMFVTRTAFERARGFPEIPLMEDIALSRLLRTQSAPLCLRVKAVTSGRRWEKHGVLRTVFTMWRLRFAYWRGADPDALAVRYGYAPRPPSNPR